MDIEFETIDGATVATLFGELDSRTAPIVQEKLLALLRPEGRVLLDMHGVTYISSAGLRALLVLYRQMAANNGQVALCGLIESIKDVMTVTGFLEFFSVYDSIPEGVAALQRDA
jgi:anti-sigma B factor antagonist